MQEAKWGEEPKGTRPELRNKTRWGSGDTEAEEKPKERMVADVQQLIVVATSFFCFSCAFHIAKTGGEHTL